MSSVLPNGSGVTNGSARSASLWARCERASKPLRLPLRFAFAVAYTVVYVRCYLGFLNVYFEYLGFPVFPRSAEFVSLSVAIAAAPVVAYRGYRALSSAIAIFIYSLLYVPIIVTFALGSSRPLTEILVVELVFMSSMIVIFFADAITIRDPFSFRLPFDLTPVVATISALSTAYILFTYRSNLSFASFGSAVYEQRFANEALGADVVTRYLSAWLAAVLAPICLTYGLTARRLIYFVIGSGACVAMYMATAAKMVVLMPALLAGCYVLLRGRGISAIYLRFVGALGIAIALLSNVRTPGTPLFLASSLIIDRTVGNGGALALLYYDFFRTNPVTDYSNITGISAITHRYPYGDAGVGQVIGRHFFAEDMNANASFWSTDGFAALGLPGVFISGILCALLLMVLNTATRRAQPAFAVLCFIPFVMALLNASLFSSFWSGGAMFLCVFFVINGRNPIIDMEPPSNPR